MFFIALFSACSFKTQPATLNSPQITQMNTDYLIYFYQEMIPSGWNNIFNPCQSVELLERSEKSVVKKKRNPQPATLGCNRNPRPIPCTESI